jgi:hypothetical protein
MKNSKIFKLHFYTIKIDDSLFNTSKNKIIDLMKLLNAGKKPTNVYELNGYKAFIKPISNNIYCFEKHRMDDLPPVGNINNDKERHLNLKNGETLIEKNYFFINKELGYIVYQEKNEGFRASTLSLYFHFLLGEDTSKIEISQILKTTAYQRLAKYGYLKGMEISFASPSNDMLKDFGISLTNRIMYQKNKNMNVSVKVSLSKKDSYSKEFIRGILNTYNKYSDKISLFKLKGSETEKGSLEDINLANDVIESVADVRIDKSHIVEDDMINALTHANTVHEDELKKLLK